VANTGYAGCVIRAALLFTLGAVVASVAATALVAQDAAVRTYKDPQGRFRFEYPASFGTPQRGTNDGFGDRLAAVRFSGLTGLGGEAVLARGPLVLDVQALGGLYDPIALEILPETTRRAVEGQRMPVDINTLCPALGTNQHVAAFAGSQQVLAAITAIERMRNVDPRVVRCDVSGDRVVFHKEATFQAGAVSTRQHIFGAVRFLAGGVATAFHIVRVLASAPSAAEMAELGALAASFTR
jgi:hypothetical protein